MSDWRKSSYSFANGNCVEAGGGSAAVLVRDSTDPDGPHLSFTPAAWTAFTRTLAARRAPAPVTAFRWHPQGP